MPDARTRICFGCRNEFTKPRRGNYCSVCAHKRYGKDHCACGASKTKTASTCIRCRPLQGEANPNWRGGRSTHAKKYKVVQRRGHPRATANGYVLEHLLVMEDHLGRPLAPEENVHHLNGVRDDNRIENLELWCKSQPSGIRARDALAWAREIISRYEPIEDRI